MMFNRVEDVAYRWNLLRHIPDSTSVMRDAALSGPEQRRRYDGDPIRAAVGVRSGCDHDCVEQIAADLPGEPVEVAQ